MKAFGIFFGLMLTSYASFGVPTGSSISSPGNNYCLCLTGVEPEYQVGFFETGCKKWLDEQQNCAVKKMEPINEKATGLNIDSLETVKKLNLGYVGHWGNTVQSINYFNRVLLPTVSQRKLDLSFDNTACRGLDRPQFFAEYFTSLIKNYKQINSADPGRYPLPGWIEQKVEYKANQAISVGMWDRYVGGSSVNFWAVVDINKTTVKIPSCRDYQDKVCHHSLQKYDRPQCIDELTGLNKTLRCCQLVDVGSGAKTHTAFWEEKESCEQSYWQIWAHPAMAKSVPDANSYIDNKELRTLAIVFMDSWS